MRARDIMTREPECCRPEQTARDAAQVMRDRDCGCVPIVDDAGTVIDHYRPRPGSARDRLGQGFEHNPERADDAWGGELRS